MKMKQEQYQKNSILNLKPTPTKIPNVCRHINKYLSLHAKCDGIAQMCSEKCPRLNHIKEEHQTIQKKDLIKQIKLEKNRKLEFIAQYLRELDQIYQQMRTKLADTFLKTKTQLQKLCFNQQEITLIQLIEVQKLHILTCSNIHYLKNIGIDRGNVTKKAKQIINKFKKFKIDEQKNNQVQWKSKFEQILRMAQSNYIAMLDQQRSTHAKLYLQSENKNIKLESEKRQMQKNLVELKKKYNNLKQQYKKKQQKEQKPKQLKEQKQKISQQPTSKQTSVIKQLNTITKEMDQKLNAPKIINTNYNAFIQFKDKQKQVGMGDQDEVGRTKMNKPEPAKQEKSRPFRFIQFRPIDLKQALQIKLTKKSDNPIPHPRPPIVQNTFEPPPQVSSFKNYISTFSQIHQNLSGQKQDGLQSNNTNFENKKINNSQESKLAINEINKNRQLKQGQSTENQNNSHPNQHYQKVANLLICNMNISSNKKPTGEATTFREQQNSLKNQRQTKDKFEKDKNDQEFGLLDKNEGFSYGLKVDEQQCTPTFNPIQQHQKQSDEFHGKSFKKKSQMIPEENGSLNKAGQNQDKVG